MTPGALPGYDPDHRQSVIPAARIGKKLNRSKMTFEHGRHHRNRRGQHVTMRFSVRLYERPTAALQINLDTFEQGASVSAFRKQRQIEDRHQAGAVRLSPFRQISDESLDFRNFLLQAISPP